MPNAPPIHDSSKHPFFLVNQNSNHIIMNTSTSRQFKVNLPVKLLLFMSLLLTLAGGKTFGQAIEWPKNDMIFQRSNSNTATVKFVLKHSSNITSVALKFQKFNISTNQWGDYVNPETGSIDNSWKSYTITSGSGTCQVSFNAIVKGSYYRVKALFNGSVESPQINFGVGEVLAIAGQSNAAGYSLNNAQSLPYGKQEVIKYFNNKGEMDGNDPGKAANTNRNFVWYWGKLGEKLATALDVPVAFHQAAWSGTSIKAWHGSLNGSYGAYPANYPYQNLKQILETTSKRTGLRGVLWHQGESDRGNDPTLGDYSSKLADIIQKSRDDNGNQKLAWVIAQVSFANNSPDNSIPSTVVDAQKRVIGHLDASGTILKSFGDPRASLRAGSDGVTDRFRGPNTDAIGSIFRRTGSGEPTHFNDIFSPISSCGQCEVSDKWFESLYTNSSFNSKNFFDNSTPTLNNQTVDVSVGCGTDCYRFYIASAHAGTPSVFKPITLTGNVLNVSDGDLSDNSKWKKVVDGGYSKLVSVTNENIAISIESGSAYDGAVVNVAPYSGASSQKWSIEQSPGQIYFFIKSSLNSNLFIGGSTGSWDAGDGDPNTKDLKLKSDTGWGANKWFMESVACPTGPICTSPAPTITANGSTSLCGGGLVSLSASGCNGGVINWSNGGTGAGTTVSAAGSYTATCTLPGCTQSGPSNSVSVTACNPVSQCYRFYVANWYASSPREKRAITLTNTSNGPVLNLIMDDMSNGSIWKQVADGAHSRLVSVTNENMNITIDGGTAYLGVTVNVAAYNGSDSQKWAVEAAPAPNQDYLYIKHKLNSGLFIGGATGSYNGGDGNNDTKDLRLDNDTAWGYNKWFRELATCPNGRISAEYVASNVDEGSTKTVVSPNPTDGIIKVKYHLTGQATVFFSFTDNLGKTILTKQVESKAGSNQTEFDLKNNPAGIYYLNLRSVQKTETVKVVKVN